MNEMSERTSRGWVGMALTEYESQVSALVVSIASYCILLGAAYVAWTFDALAVSILSFVLSQLALGCMITFGLTIQIELDDEIDNPVKDYYGVEDP